jgi:hypothetical protein
VCHPISRVIPMGLTKKELEKKIWDIGLNFPLDSRAYTEIPLQFNLCLHRFPLGTDPSQITRIASTNSAYACENISGV